MQVRSIITIPLKALALILLASFGACAAIGIAITLTDSLVRGELDITFVQNFFSYQTSLGLYLVITMLPAFGLFGITHVFVSYIVLFRSSAYFWKNYWLIAPLLIVGASVFSVLSESLLYAILDIAPPKTRFFTIPVGYWIAARWISQTRICRGEDTRNGHLNPLKRATIT